jgi:ATP-dependent protease ClpP protease subunit
MKEFELTQKRMIEHYKKSTGLDEARIKESLLPPHDVWLSADEALLYHICDHIADVAR